MKISFIIPVYNGKNKVERCLDSIYSQGINTNDFEIICVDDASPDSSSIKALEEYRLNSKYPSNLKIIIHTENKRQGGARNTGVAHANGDYIHFIDQDDVFNKDVLLRIIDIINKESGIDMVMFDHSLTKDGETTKNRYGHNDNLVYTGLEFFKKNEFTWAPWGYIYRTKFLTDNNIRFVEKVQFEDVDWVVDCISHAHSIRFEHLSTVHYTHNEDSQTNIGNDSLQKVDFLGKQMNRVQKLALKIANIDLEASNIIKNHYLCGYKILTYRLIYLPLSDKKRILNDWYKGRFNESDNQYLKRLSKNPMFMGWIIHLASPMLRLIVKSKKNYRKLK